MLPAGYLYELRVAWELGVLLYSLLCLLSGNVALGKRITGIAVGAQDNTFTLG